MFSVKTCCACGGLLGAGGVCVACGHLCVSVRRAERLEALEKALLAAVAEYRLLIDLLAEERSKPEVAARAESD